MIGAHPHRVQVYAQVQGVDEDSNPVWRPGTTPTVVRCRVAPVSAEEAAVIGQDVTSLMRVIATRWPVGPWSRVEWGGRTWDVVGEPQRHPGATPATAHVSVLLRSRTPEGV